MKSLKECGISAYPWHCHEQEAVVSDNLNIVCDEVAPFDMRLIAAAPKLYNACVQALWCLGDSFYSPYEEASERLRDALASASGTRVEDWYEMQMSRELEKELGI